MYFVLKQHQEYGRTYDNNVRIGGYQTIEQARATAIRISRGNARSPCLVKDHARNIIGMAKMGVFTNV